MILRSLSKHVKDQNWFAVSLDFAIVVIGVFIGIQVANWNDLQAERAQTQRMVSELMADLREMREIAADQSSWYLERATLIDALLDSLEAGVKTKPDELARTFNQAMWADVPPSLPAGVNELLVAGRLDLLSDAPVRDALNRLLTITNLIATSSTELFHDFRSATPSIRPYLSSSRAPDFDYRKESYEVITAVDIEALQSDAEARLALAELYRFNANMRALSQVTKESIADVIAAVSNSGH